MFFILLFCRQYSEQQRTSRLKARRARLAEGRKKEERARLAEFGILPTSPNNSSKSYNYDNRLGANFESKLFFYKYLWRTLFILCMYTSRLATSLQYLCNYHRFEVALPLLNILIPYIFIFFLIFYFTSLIST